jgi:DNA-binding winged helix-turn-helix (wHTH) protein
MKEIQFESLYPNDAMYDQVEKLADFVKKGMSSQVIGLPGTGKSTLLKLLAYNTGVRTKHFGEEQKNFHFVYMDFSEIKKRPMLDVIKFMIISLAYSLQERGLTQQSKQINIFLQEAILLQDELILFQTLKRSVDFLTQEDFSLIFLFDRLDQYLPDITEHFFINLKVLRNRAKYKFSAVFSLSRPLDVLVEPQILAEFYESVAGNTIFMPLSDLTGLAFRLSYLEKLSGKTIDKKVFENILHLTGGHNKLTHTAIEAVLSERESPMNLEEFLLKRRQIQATLYGLWEYLTPHEKAHLKNMTSDELAGDEDIIFLTHAGLIAQNGEILIPLFSGYIDALKNTGSQTLEFKPETNEIYKGEENITQNLSPSEFRILRFFIQNKDKVLEKDAIIQAVWKDTKTREGVTDQALDQIIYRLRKKIEDNPNDPHHLQTMKGKGYKFSI